MNIAITGVHGVGKTTLFNKLELYLDGDIVTLNETPRHYIDASGFTINEDANEVSQLLIAYKMAYQVCDTYFNDNNISIISDRCLIDCAVYTESLYRRGNFSKKHRDEVIKLAEENLEYFDLVLYVRPTVFAPIKDDGIRATDIAYRNSIQELFDDYVYRWLPAKKVVKISGNEQELLQQALMAIDKLK